MKFLARLNTIHVAAIFLVTFLVFIVPLLILIQKVKWHHLALRLHYFWSRTFMVLAMIPVEIVWHYKPAKNFRFVLCSNHFSYFDIPLLAYLPFDFKFIGKSSIARVPVFGYMYRKLHVTVNRSSFKSRANSMQRVREMVDHGFNIAFYPEGGIRSKEPPHMASFKEGAFRLAVEKQLPVLPVSLPDNYLFLPDENGFRVYRRRLRIVVHPPIFPRSTDEREIIELKNKTFEVIQSALLKEVAVKG